MRTFKLMTVAALAMSTAACVESVDGNYGYSDGYYAPSQDFYAQPAYYAPTYYAPTQVVTQTRYLPVPAAVPQHASTPQAQVRNTPATPQQPAANNQHHGNGGGNNTSHDRNS
jgi:hypothetical protein